MKLHGSVLLSLACALAATLAAAPVQARAALARSEPADGALLSAAPAALQLWLREAISSAELALSDLEGRAIMLPAPSLQDYQPAAAALADQFDATYLFLCSAGFARLPTLLTVGLPPLAPGTYQLSWRARSLSGGRALAGSLVFALRPAGSAAAPTANLRSATVPASTSGLAADLLVTLALRPNRPGPNFVQVDLADTRRPAPAPISQVRVRLQPPGATQASPLYIAERRAEGGFQLAADDLSASGTWQVEIVVSRAGLADAQLILPWQLPPLAEQPQVTLAGMPSSLNIRLVLVALGSLALAAVALRYTRRKR